MVMGCYRIKKYGNSRTIHIKREEHVHCRTISIWYSKRAWQLSSFPRWWRYIVYVTNMPVFEIKTYVHSSSYKKSLIERTIQYINDRIKESFDDYFPCKKKKCNLKHVKNWLNLFVDFYNKELNIIKWTKPRKIIQYCHYWILVWLFYCTLPKFLFRQASRDKLMYRKEFYRIYRQHPESLH